MSGKARTLTLAAVCLSVLLGVPAIAQSPVGPTVQDNEPNEHHRRIYRLMEDLTLEMSVMAQQMVHDELHGDLSPEQRQRMVERMAVMSRMMTRLSGLDAKPAISHGNLQKQIDQMRKQFGEMKSAPSMKPAAR
jgi:hypothetical protein